MPVNTNHILVDFLLFAVPLQILAIKRGEARMAEGANRVRIATLIGQHSDDMLYGGPYCKQAVVAVVEAIATCAFAPGGIEIFGMHFEDTLE